MPETTITLSVDEHDWLQSFMQYLFQDARFREGTQGDIIKSILGKIEALTPIVFLEPENALLQAFLTEYIQIGRGSLTTPTELALYTSIIGKLQSAERADRE